MQIKGTLTKGLLIALVLTLVPTTAFSAQKITAGSICKVYKQKFTFQKAVFTCIKSGKKLVWAKKEITVKNELSNETKTKNAYKAWDENISDISVSDAAQESFINWINSRPALATNHVLIYQENLPFNRFSQFKRVNEINAKIFSPLLQKQSIVVIGKEEKWVVDKINSLGGNIQACNHDVGGEVVSCRGGTNLINGFVYNTDANYNPKYPNADGSSSMAHEYFHTVQIDISGSLQKSGYIMSEKEYTNNFFPVWFIEGSANFIGFSIAAMAGNSTYKVGRPQTLLYAPRTDPALNKNSIADYEIRTGEGNDTPTYPYVIGQIAIEFLIASVGFQNFMNIFLDYKNSGNFQESFKKCVGISKEDFYKKFDSHRIKLGLPSISWKLEGIVNKPINN